MANKISLALELAWQISVYEANLCKTDVIEQEHVLIGICSLEKIPTDQFNQAQIEGIKQEQKEVNAYIAQVLNQDCRDLRRKLRSAFNPGKHPKGQPAIHRSAKCKEVFRKAEQLVDPDTVLTCLHFLKAVYEPETNQSVNQIDPVKKPNNKIEHPSKRTSSDQPTPMLDKYGRDLTTAASDGKLGPFIGRRSELLQIIQILTKEKKNNPVLVGEAGVGKTAIVEALAIRIVEGKDPQALDGKRIVEVNMGGLLAGAQYRGEFEERITEIIKEASYHPEIILFIDELHTIMGAGRIGEGGLDAGNILKPALARGDIKVIGATTIAEYRKYIESDPALERRFEMVLVKEPTWEETFEMLLGIRKKLEVHYQTSYTEAAIKSAIDLSIRFDTDHQLPDKAVDLLDRAGALIKVPTLSMVPGMSSMNDGVTEVAIAKVLAGKKNLPLDIVLASLGEHFQSRVLGLANALKEKIVGQDEAIERISKRLMLAHSGLGRSNGPLATFLFLGSSGIGKTEVAKTIAEYLFGDPKSLIRLDMSEYTEEYSVSKLIGSPPGYVGYEEEGQLTGKIRSRPYSVVLLDECDKAYAGIFDFFLQLFDEGRLTDSKGRTVDARNVIFIMTANILLNIRSQASLHSMDHTSFDQKELSKYFRIEFLNRIDDIVPFRSLSEEDARRILVSLLNGLQQTLSDRYQVELKISESATEYLILMGYSKAYGARELRRAVEKYIQEPLSEIILKGNLGLSSSWTVNMAEGCISIQPCNK